MTDKQLEQAKKAHFTEWREKGYTRATAPEEAKRRGSVLSCIDMINSILAYQSAGEKNAEKVLQVEEKRKYNYLAEYIEILGRDEVLRLIQAQIDDIVTVRTGVFTDDEGLSYNSIVFRDEI